MLKIRINHTHLSKIKKKKKKKKWNLKKSGRKVITYKPKNVALHEKRSVVLLHTCSSRTEIQTDDRGKEIIVYLFTNEKWYRYHIIRIKN